MLHVGIKYLTKQEPTNISDIGTRKNIMKFNKLNFTGTIFN